MKTFFIAASAFALLSSTAIAKEQITIVGSSTVYPFTTAVAEAYGKATGKPTPVVESTGTGGGIKLFCAGVGEDTPDVVNASRRMKKSEFETCQKNGVTNILEIKVGFDGIVIAHAANTDFPELKKEEIFSALAEAPSNDFLYSPENWNDVSPDLPNTKIEVLGPPPTSGTRDSFAELVMEKGAERIPAFMTLKQEDPEMFEKFWKSMRKDGGYVEAGENDNLIVQKLEANPNALGIFGYSFLEENQGKITAVKIDGVAPTYETIASGEYTVSRPLYIYVKGNHMDTTNGLKEFLQEYVSDKAIGEDGYLADKSLIPLPEDQLQVSREEVESLSPLKIDGLK